MTWVIHIDNRRGDEREIYCGRAGHGFDGYFGNPIVPGKPCLVCLKRHENGGDTIPCFRVYANQRIETDPEYRRRVKGLHGHILMCFCAPNPCHCNVYVEISARLHQEDS